PSVIPHCGEGPGFQLNNIASLFFLSRSPWALVTADRWFSDVRIYLLSKSIFIIVNTLRPWLD
ncbi:MAG TPA: hypothetical protein VLM43_03225, partial [Desulfobacterales bacterium]|nr:hypothetical protein [Desulfobacterales bacterium]